MTVVDATGSPIDLMRVLHGLIPGMPGNTVDINLRSEEA